MSATLTSIRQRIFPRLNREICHRRATLRGEIGERFDYTAMTSPEATLTLRARVAWAHNWVSDHSITAAFQTLPGASFIVNGAWPATDSGLVSAGAELRLANGVTLMGKVDGELARHSTTNAGTGTLRLSWWDRPRRWRPRT